MSCNVRKRPHSELAPPARRLPTGLAPPAHRLPTELWQTVCSYLYPSQLARLSRVNRTLYRLVANMRLWSTYFIQLKGRRWSFPLYDHLRNKPQYHMQYIIALSYHVCDQCIILSHSDSPQKFAAMPLSILEWPSPEPDQADYYPPPGKIHLCLPCRRKHYAIYPEAIPSQIVGRYLPKGLLKNTYFVGEENIKSIKDRRSYESKPGGPSIAVDDPNGSFYSEQAVLANARFNFGGDVGIETFREDPFYISELSEQKQRAIENQFRSFVSSKRRRITSSFL